MGAAPKTQYQSPSAHAGRRLSGRTLAVLGVSRRRAGIGALQPVADDAEYGRRCPEADVYSAKLLTKFKAVTGLRKPINDQPR